ncbi:MAG: hypothetical protein GX335_02535 [Firmicutes bacterium]|nr:hypothetical protein [Bacillota bacterium]
MSHCTDHDGGFQRECIYVTKVYNECKIIECPTYNIPIPPTCPPVVNVVDCALSEIDTEGFVTSSGEISLTVNFVLNVEYDGNGTPQFIEQTAQFRRNGLRLEGVVPAMDVIILPLLTCVGCRPGENGSSIECDVGVYLVVKAVALVQMEVMGRFCPEPPLCEEVSPLGCTEWLALAESGAFWPPFPPQPPRRAPQDPRPRPPVYPKRPLRAD